MASIYKDFYFYLSADLPLDFKVHIDHLDATALSAECGEDPEDLLVSVRLMDGGIPLASGFKATRMPHQRGSCVFWGEWLALPMKIRDLPKTAQLVVELWTVEMKLVGGTTLRCFDHRLRLKRGLQKVVIWPSASPFSAGRDPWTRGDTTVPPARPAAQDDVPRLIDLVRPDDELHLLKLMESYDLMEMPRTPWTDRMLMAQLKKDLLRARSAAHSPRRRAGSTPPARGAQYNAAAPQSRGPMYLYMHFPVFDYPVIFEELFYPSIVSSAVPPLITRPLAATSSGGGRPVTRSGLQPDGEDTSVRSGYGSSFTPYWYEHGSFAMVGDPEDELESPAEVKYHKLARSMMRNVVDTGLKPNTRELGRIHDALAVPTLDVRMPAEVKDLFWKFRYSLTSNKKALVKFLLCVDWDEEEDAREAIALLPKWAPIDTEDALRMLSSDFRMRVVREHAVAALRRASDDEIMLYLLQLVQALRYEPDLMPTASGSAGASTAAAAPGVPGTSLSPLADMLVDRACSSVELGNFLHWYLSVELEDPRMGAVFARVHTAFLMRLPSHPRGREVNAVITRQGEFLQELAAAIVDATSGGRNIPDKIRRLNESLRPGGAYGELCMRSEPVPMPLHPGISVSGVVPGECHIFKSALYPTVVSLAVHASSRIDWASKPTTQGLTIHAEAAAAAARLAGGDRAPAARSARASATRFASPMAALAAAAASAADDDSVTDAAASSASLAVAAAMPAGGPPPATYKVLFKNGDDMRQDQLIIQMIRLMDAQLKRVGLDLRLTPYRVIATSTNSGIMELVLGSHAISKVVENYNNSIQAFFRKHSPSPTDEYGISAEVMDNYVKSSAGYCVITYLLGVGDRHLDNILLTEDGHFLHIDYGYIFGRDPKPMVSPIRVTKAMIDGMGGWESNNYRSFKKYCCKAFNILRKSANLFLTLLNLMRDAGIESLAEQTDVTLAKLQDKFRLDIRDDEVADQVFLKLVDESVAAFFPALWEFLHKVRVAMR